MREKITHWWKIFLKGLGIVFGVLGALSVLFPLPDVSEDNFLYRLLILTLISLLVLLISILISIHQIKANSICVYSREKTKYYFEYGDIKKILEDKKQFNNHYTIVVPVNTDLKDAFNLSVIKADTIHAACLEYLYNNKANSISLDLNFIQGLQRKSFRNNKTKGQLGDFFFISSKDIGSDCNVRFLFWEMFEIEKKYGDKRNSGLSRTDYLHGIQSLLQTIEEMTDQEEEVFIPLIGAGAGNVAKANDILHLFYALLRFNKSILRQRIHIVIYEKKKDDAPIFNLIKF